MNSKSNAQLVEQFSRWLDESDAVSSIAAGDDSENSTTDLFSLYVELAALKNEVRLESRQLKSALEKFGALFDTLQQSNERQGRALDALRGANTQALADAESRLLLGIIDLRDRLEAGLGAAKGYRSTGLARLSSAPADFVTRLADGMAISLRRVDELLVRYRVQPVAVVGSRLDPDTMQAHSVECHPDLPDGSVVAELRKGYARHGERLRLAEVIVNKHSVVARVNRHAQTIR
jgi:molecular chaperone GrpE